jgi:hypothetical protein
MDIKYFNLATLFATGLFFAFAITGYSYDRAEYFVFYLISLGVIWGSYFIMRKK